MDTNGDGTIGIGELQHALGELGVYALPATIEALFSSLDHDESGMVEYKELHKVCALP